MATKKSFNLEGWPKWVKCKMPPFLQQPGMTDQTLNYSAHQTWNLQRIWWQFWDWSIPRHSTQNSWSLIGRSSVALRSIVAGVVAIVAIAISVVLITIPIIPVVTAAVRSGRAAQVSQRIADKSWLTPLSLIIKIRWVWGLRVKWQNRGKNIISIKEPLIKWAPCSFLG